MNTLTFDTRQAPLLSWAGIPFPMDYAELHTSLDVSLHLEGTVSFSVTDERLYAMADPADLREQACSAVSIAISEAAEQIGRPSRIPDCAEKLLPSVRARLAGPWAELYGVELASLAVTRVTVEPEHQAMIDEMDSAAAFAAKTPEERLSTMADTLLRAQAEAIGSVPWKTETWKCGCGAVNRGNFCTSCGKPRTWVCECKTVNAGNFCVNCGKPRR